MRYPKRRNQLTSLSRQTRSSKPKPPAKWTVYESILQIPYYFVFSRYTEQLRFFQLVEGRYQEQPLDIGDPRAWIEELQIGLGLWQGEYQGISRRWLRWFDTSGHWILTEAEAAQVQAQAALSRAEAAELAQAEAEVALEQERQRRSRLFEQLRQLGIDPDQLDQG